MASALVYESRTWRSFSSGVISPKFAPGFGVGRGRGDGPNVGFAAGCGRANFSGSGLLHGPPAGGPIGASIVPDK